MKPSVYLAQVAQIVLENVCWRGIMQWGLAAGSEVRRPRGYQTAFGLNNSAWSRPSIVHMLFARRENSEQANSTWCEKYNEFLGFLAQKQATGLHVAQIRSGLLTHDQDHNHQLTKTVNAMWRLSWAKTESEKVSLLWQFCLRGIKREGVSLLKEINELKKLWYPEPCHDLLGLSKTTIHRNSKPLAN